MIPRYKAIDNETGVMLRVLSIDLEFDYIIGLPFEEEARDTFGELIIEKRYYFEDMERLQSKGLFDKNGKEIYEGDIVKFKNPYDKRFKALGVVVLREDKACFGIDMEGTTEQFELYRITAENYLTVIGNIYQDEHLLGED
ncbi:YopX family protein [Mammaliicoccus sciuri]|uniref:YopX family protein n=1 Tax=Mammaliicoccus sciuri TaxID=1296 RepID=UPI0019525422|nr:YopX family protein [Mammaliicoccus sciuri]